MNKQKRKGLTIKKGIHTGGEGIKNQVTFESHFPIIICVKDILIPREGIKK